MSAEGCEEQLGTKGRNEPKVMHLVTQNPWQDSCHHGPRRALFSHPLESFCGAQWSYKQYYSYDQLPSCYHICLLTCTGQELQVSHDRTNSGPGTNTFPDLDCHPKPFSFNAILISTLFCRKLSIVPATKGYNPNSSK